MAISWTAWGMPESRFALIWNRANLDSGANAAAQSFQVGPLADQPRQQVLMLGQFNLQLTFVSTGVSAEDVENQSGAVDYLGLERFFQVSLLGGS